MPFRLIGTIILLLIVTVFAGANLDNRCDINFIFTKVTQVPVFLTAIVSFLIGAAIMIPFTFKKNVSKNRKTADETQKEEEESKTLFDFKIKKDTARESKKDKKSIFKKKVQEEKADTQDEAPSEAEIKDQ